VCLVIITAGGGAATVTNGDIACRSFWNRDATSLWWSFNVLTRLIFDAIVLVGTTSPTYM